MRIAGMFSQRKTFNPKRALADNPPRDKLERLAQMVCYRGNPEHKRNPGDFGLTPPACAKRSKMLCDDAGVFSRETANRLLREGVKRGLVSKQERNGFPQNIWAVTEDKVPLEAQLENEQTGAYHGYPMDAKDRLFPDVCVRWNEGGAHENKL